MFVDDFRPKTIQQVVGREQQRLLSVLTDKIIESSPLQKILITGPSGIGKTTVAKIYARWLLCTRLIEIREGELHPCGECEGCSFSHINITEMNCASATGIDNIRELISNIRITGFGSYRKVYILDEVHALTKAAQNALLTPLESLPEHVFFVFITTEPNGLLQTLRSRFMEFYLTVPDNKEQASLAYSIGLKHDKPLDKQELEMLIYGAAGNVRTLVHNTERYITLGELNPEHEAEENKASIINVLFKRNPSVPDIFREIAKISDYNTTVNILCRYSARILAGGEDDYRFPIAYAVLERFGDGLSPHAREEFSFMKKILDVVGDLM